jgi:heterodisulfide reductase subunit B
MNHRNSIHLPGRNLVMAEKKGLDMVVPCPLCFNRLKTAEKELSGANKEQYDIHPEGSKIAIQDLANFLSQQTILSTIEQRMEKDLKGLKSVCYYGCMASRPPGVTGEIQYENPMSMDLILERLGVDVIQWSFKTDCCGASHLVARPDIVFELVGRLYSEASRSGANCIVVSCQMCQANLDLHQYKILEQMGADYQLPIIYFTELIGLALCHGDTGKWMKRHFVDPIPLIAEECRVTLP